MFIGHFAVGFGAKRVAPAISLGTFFLACQLADLVWPNFVLLGLERFEIEPGATAVTPLNFISYPYSHSLAALTGWSILFALLLRTIGRRGMGAVVTVAGVTLSHWILDAITHRPDMPLTVGGAQRVGLGLWNSIPGTVVTETLLFIAGVALYVRSTRARDRIGSIALWILVGLLYAISIANLFSPPPPGIAAVAWTAQAMWLFVAWGYWIDRHRAPA